jgi:hypothetical protein
MFIHPLFKTTMLNEEKINLQGEDFYHTPGYKYLKHHLKGAIVVKVAVVTALMVLTKNGIQRK